MEKMIGVINNNLRSVITGIKEHREETEKNLAVINAEMDEKVGIASEYKKEVEKASQGIEVKNGYVEFVITHCSTYFLAEKELPTIEVSHEADNSNIENSKVEDNQKIETTPVQTADSNQLLLPIIGIALVGAVFAIKHYNESEKVAATTSAGQTQEVEHDDWI